MAKVYFFVLLFIGITLQASAQCSRDIIIVLDNSGSIDNSEWSQMTNSTNQIIDAFLANPYTRVAVAHYASPSPQTLAQNSFIYIESDFTQDPVLAKSFTRRSNILGNSDYLSESMTILKDAILGNANAQIISPQKTFNHLSSNELGIFIFTDAQKNGNTSFLISQSNIADPYYVYNDFKSTLKTTFTMVHIHPSTSDMPAGATIASVGLNYGGNLENNPGDPEGNGVKPRRYIPKSSFSLSNSEISAITSSFICPCKTNFSFSNNCIGDPSLFNPLNNYSTYNWSFGDGTQSSQSNPSHTYTQTGSYQVSLTTTDVLGCVSDTSFNIYINPKATIQVSSQDVCIGASTLFTANYTLPSGSIDHFFWDLGNGVQTTENNPSVLPYTKSYTYANSGTYNIELGAVTDSGCSTTVYTTAHVYNYPNVFFESSNFCENSQNIVSNLSPTGGVFTLTTNNPQASVDINNGLITQGTSGYDYVLNYEYQQNGCSSSWTDTIEVFEQKSANFSLQDFCFGSQQNVQVSEPGGFFSFSNPPADGATIDPNSGLLSNYSENSTYEVKYQLYDQCPDSSVMSVHVLHQPSALFTIQPACLGQNNVVLPEETGGLFTMNQIPLGSASIDPNTGIISNPVQGSTYEINYSFSGNCPAQHTQSIEFSPIPSAQFEVQNQCLNGDLPFVQNTSQNNGAQIASYVWNFNNGQSSNLQNPSPTFLSSGTYDIKLVLTSDKGCQDSIQKPLEVFEIPEGHVQVETTKGCVPFCTSISFDPNPNNTSNSYELTWSFPDEVEWDAVSQNLCFNQKGQYGYSLNISNQWGCKNIIEKADIFEGYNNPIADFSPSSYEMTLSEALVSFSNQSIDAVEYAWDLGDLTLSNEKELTHRYQDTGTYIIQLEAISEHGCKDITSKEIQVIPDFSIYVPNTFTVNEDELNEQFYPLMQGALEDGYEFCIFNRWGELLFKDNHLNAKWDGKDAKGDICKQDVYIYKVTVQGIHQKKIETLTGHVNLLR